MPDNNVSQVVEAVSEPEPTPDPPATLRDRGRRFWLETVEAYDLRHDELQILAEACHLMDEVDDMRAALREVGPVVRGSRNQPRPSGLLEQIRSHSLAIERLLARLGFADSDAEAHPVPKAVSEAARRAAYARWRGARGRAAIRHSEVL